MFNTISQRSTSDSSIWIMQLLLCTSAPLGLCCDWMDHSSREKGRHCCSVGELKITFASTCNHGCKESVFNVLFNVLFLVLDFPLGAPNTLLKHVIERSIWRIVVGEGSWWGWGFSQDWWLGFWSCWSLSLTAVFWIDFSVACFRRV